MAEFPETINFQAEELKTLKYWQEIDAFRSSLKMSKGRPRFTFYDGPPFATGSPHYGTILAGTLKDVVTRWAYQSGFYVERRFGWDCHGLPVEHLVDKTLKIDGPEAVRRMGVDKYNAECRKVVMANASEWREVVGRYGRWVDFDNDYKTMSPTFMETVWWVFKQLFDKNLVYRGVKVMPYSTACCTPLSNFEASQNFKEVDDPAVTVAFQLENETNVAFLAWTTTPWTLPSNLALCVNKDLKYVKVEELATERFFILAESRLSAVFQHETAFKILERFQGDKLEGVSYKPLFNHFEHLKAQTFAFRVLCDSYVTDSMGTGIVHQAPYFGEDDYRVCLKNDVITKAMTPVCPIDERGRFTAEIPDLAGKTVKEADKEICKLLKQKGALFHHGQLKHNYPFCWRSNTPLIYRAVPSWFVKVEPFTDRLLEHNEATHWVPSFVKDGRFANWLKDARDWAVSRNRFWGTPIPVWTSEDGEEVVCVGSVAELKELSGFQGEITDLHKQFVDQLTIPSSRGKGVLRRTPEVFDCWFESGSMPYAQLHFPFENKESFFEGFPADFIAEGLDQTRGWFYTLLVLSTLLFDKPPFKNVVVNGIVLNEKGEKMSKSQKNYPDPMEVANKYGADAVRLYLVTSPAVRAEPLKFREDGVQAVVREVCIPWFNALRLFEQNAHGLTFDFELKKAPSSNIMDRWFLSYTQTLVKMIREEMAAYRLYNVTPLVLKFVTQLTKWYVRMNKRRLKGETNDATDREAALRTLFSVLLTSCRLLAPFLPFFTEFMYQHLKKHLQEKEMGSPPASVHFLMLPVPVDALLESEIETAVQRLQNVVKLGRAIRDRLDLAVKIPLGSVVVVAGEQAEVDDLVAMKQYLTEDLNVRQFVATTDRQAFGIQFQVLPDLKRLGNRLKSKLKQVQKELENLTEDQANEFQTNGSLTVCGEILTLDDVLLNCKMKSDHSGGAEMFEVDTDGRFFVLLDVNVDSSMRTEGLVREFTHRVQYLRKKAHLQPHDAVIVYYDVSKCDDTFKAALKISGALLYEILRQPCKPFPVTPGEKEIATASFDVKNGSFKVTLTERY